MKDTQPARRGQHLPATRVVCELASLNFVGNIIPAAWFQHPLLKTSGKSPKTHTNAVLILSEIIYWYRPMRPRDEATGREKLCRKFKADKLQKSYQQLADYFGLTKKQVRDAIAFLKERGIITVELRDLPGLSNVMFLEPVVAKVKELGEVESDATDYDAEVTPSALQVTPSALQVTPSDLKVETYTKTPTKTPTKNTHTTPQPPTAEPARASVCVKSKFSLQEVRRHVDALPGIRNPGGLATKLHRTGDADAEIEARLNNKGAEPTAAPGAQDREREKLKLMAEQWAERGDNEGIVCASLLSLRQHLQPDEVSNIARQAVRAVEFRAGLASIKQQRQQVSNAAPAV